jgi:predicted deacylase
LQIESRGHGSGNLASHNQTPVAGLWRPLVKLWDPVAEGDLLGTVNDLYGNALAEIRAQLDGVLIALPRMQYVGQGAQCGIVV